MSIEEFLRFLKESEESEAHYKKLYIAYSKKLPTELVKIVFDHLPEVRDKYEKEIFSIAEKYMQEIREQYNHAYSYHSHQDSVPELLFAKKELEDIPEKYFKGYKQVFWESYEETYGKTVYEYAVYEKMKEVFVEFYLDDLLELDSDYLRYFDSSVYLMCSNEFVQEVYVLCDR